MLRALFSSKVRVGLLKLFLFNPENSFYQREIALRVAHPIRGIQREVERLCGAGIIESSPSGNRIYYRLNKSCPISEELKKIVFKSSGIAEVLKQQMTGSANIRAAFIYGSYAKGEENMSSDIDLLVVGDISSRELSAILAGPKLELGRAIDYSVFPAEEFRRKVEEKNSFAVNVLKDKKIFIVGNENELKDIVAGR